MARAKPCRWTASATSRCLRLPCNSTQQSGPARHRKLSPGRRSDSQWHPRDNSHPPPMQDRRHRGCRPQRWRERARMSHVLAGPSCLSFQGGVHGRRPELSFSRVRSCRGGPLLVWLQSGPTRSKCISSSALALRHSDRSVEAQPPLSAPGMLRVGYFRGGGSNSFARSTMH